MIYRYSITFFILLTYLCASSQVQKEQLIGEWIKVNMDMADGSQSVLYYPNRIFNMRLNIQKNHLYRTTYPAKIFPKKSGLEYNISQNRLVVSEQYEWVVEKVTSDSLILIENIVGLDIDKLKRYTFNRKEMWKEKFDKKFEGDSEIEANPFYTPLMPTNLADYIWDKYKNGKDSLELSGNLILYPAQKKLIVETLKGDNTNSEYEMAIVRHMEKSYKKWDIKGFEHYSQIKIPFIVSILMDGKNQRIRAKLFANSIDDINADYGAPYKVITSSSEYFDKGIIAYSRGQLVEASEYFTKSYEINHTLIDAIYNRAVVYIDMNRVGNACEDWALLNELGQRKSVELYNLHCQ